MVIEVLVYTAVAIGVLSSWLMLRMKDEYQMLHFLALPASLTATLITLAIFLQRGLKPESFKALLIAAILLMMNAAVSHASARAFRIRDTRNQWRPEEGEEVPLLPRDQKIKPPASWEES